MLSPDASFLVFSQSQDTTRDVPAWDAHAARFFATRLQAGADDAILEREGARDVGGIIHCFSEDRPFAARALDLGFDVSFSGIVTFKSAVAVQDVAVWAPLDRILVETDSPYLAPVPMRGKRCEPAMVSHTARRVAELRGVSAEEVAEATTRNTQRRFGKTFPALQ